MRRLAVILVGLTVVVAEPSAQLSSFSGYGVPYPAYPQAASGVPGLTTFTIDAATETICTIYSASAAKNIHKIHYRTGSTTTGDTLDLRVETVDGAANGDPTGTLWAVNTNGASVLANGDDLVWKSVTLTADATVAIGDVFALCLVNGGGGGNFLIQANNDTGGIFPYSDHFATAAWAKNAFTALIIPEYSDGTFEPLFGYPDVGGPINTQTFKSDDATNRRGNIFRVPGQARAKGCWAWVDADATFTCKLYDSDGTTVLATTAATNAFQRFNTTGGVYFLPFTTTPTIYPSTNYRIAVGAGTTSNISTYDFDVPAAGMLDMFPGGQNMHRSVFTSSAWVETTTSRTYIGVFLDAVGGGRRRIIGG